jgi:aspartate racemase
VPNESLPRAHRNRLGIITGSGPEAGLDLWAKILRANRVLMGERYEGDLSAPTVTVFSEPELGLSMELERNDAAVWRCLCRVATALAPHVDYYGIACNTLNYYQHRLTALGLPAKLISVGDVVSDYVRANGLERVALLGARPVTDMGPWSPYRGLLEHVEVELPADGLALHRLIYEVKAHGGEAPGLAQRFAALLDTLQAETVLLACTELPLIVVPERRQRLVDVTDLLALSLARKSLAARTQPVEVVA